MKLKILVCCHKDDIKVENEFYNPIHVGKSISNSILPIQGDHSGDNISCKNASYCELTGIYWAWKNLKNIDYIGLSHYRRYFDFNPKIFSTPSHIISTSSFSKMEFNVPQEVIKSLEEGNIILAKTESLKVSLYTDYCVCHNGEDLRTLEKSIKNLNDYRYSQAFDRIMYGNNELHPYNMFVMSWKEYDKYCTWLFTILSEVESQIDISEYNSYQKRIFGFMGERLLNIYVEANALNVKTYPVIFITNELQKARSYPFYILKKKLNKLISRYASPSKKLFINK